MHIGPSARMEPSIWLDTNTPESSARSGWEKFSPVSLARRKLLAFGGWRNRVATWTICAKAFALGAYGIVYAP